jgi:polyisoprenoid-binding protein YceI
MNRQLTAAVAAAAFSALWAGQAMAEPKTYDIDIVHSGIVFKIDHLGFSKVMGMAREFGGMFVFDPDAPTQGASLQVSVKVDSIFTNNEQRDSDIQGADWFNATEFPEITFVGNSYEQTGDGVGKITGELTIAGVTNSATLDVTQNGIGANPWSGVPVAGFGATTKIKRSDFGLTANIPMIGDEVELIIQIEGVGRQ